MPPAPVATRESRMANAASRWAAILATRPELAPAVALQEQLITRVVDLTEIVERAPLPRLSLPPRYLAAKLTRGIPALAAEPMPLPLQVMTPALLGMCDALARGGAGDTAEHIKSAIVESRFDAGSLLTASFNRDQHAIRAGATHRGLSADLVWLVAELAVSPYVHVLQNVLLSPSVPDPALSAALATWSHGYCPACGSWPALAEIHDSHRILRCSFCAHAWELKTYACVYCGTANERFVTFAGSVDRPDLRVEICGGCGGYLKTVDVEELSPFPLLAIADLETMELDMMAMEKEYRRPPLMDFKRPKR
jgi:FdhE protein